jgi:hypothetical protein
MKRICDIARIAVTVATAATLYSWTGRVEAATSAQEIHEILDTVDDLFRGPSSHGKMSMVIVTENGTRPLTLEQWSKGSEQFLIRILEPEKERGITTLKAEKNIWNYHPKVDRTVKLSASMMSGSWMGSHFTNNDLMKKVRYNEGYEATVKFEGQRDGQDVVELELKPKPNVAVVWGKLVILVRKADHLPIKIDHFDDKLALAQTMTFSDIKTLGGRKLPTNVRLVPTDKPKERTDLKYDTLDFGVALEDGFFSLRSLQKR